MKFQLICCALLLFSNLLSAQTTASDIEAILQNHVQNRRFSGTVLVAEQGKVIYQKSFGQAGATSQTKLENDFHYHIASVTKMFTAILVLQLSEENKLSLDTSIQTYLPDLEIPNSNKITIRHLLLHISGLPFGKRKSYAQSYSPHEWTKQALKNRSKAKINSFNYNDVDYALLGLVTEAVTQKTWYELVQQRILNPLEMENTGFLAKDQYPDRFAYTFTYKKNNPKADPAFYIENMYAAASIYATAADLLKLDQALYHHQLLSEASLEEMSKSYPEYNYVGTGVWNYQYPFVKSNPTIMERRGGVMGANVVLVRMTDDNKTIIILSNNDQFNPDSFGDENNLREALMRLMSN